MKGMTLLALAASLVMGAHARADDRDLWMFAQWAGDHRRVPSARCWWMHAFMV